MPPVQEELHPAEDKMPKPRHHLNWIPLLVAIMLSCAFLQGYLSGISAGENTYHTNCRELTTVTLPKASGESGTASSNLGQISLPQMKAVLSGDENAVYDSVAAAIRNFDDQAVFTVRSETAVSMERVIEIARIAQETPEFFWVESITWCTWTNNPDGTRTYTLDITYWLTKEERNAYLLLLEAKLARLQDQFGASDIFEASKQVNKYLTYNTSYVQNKAEQLEHPYDTILGPLIFRQAICSGYAKTYNYLMSMLGYESAYCLGYTDDNVFHAWTAIRDDGNVYYTDPTFNSTSGFSKKWLNLSRSNFAGHQETEKYWYR